MFQVREMAFHNLKYAGRSKALVEDNVDPQKRGRIRVSHPLLGEKSVWIHYLTSPGTYSVPSIGDVVYVEADTGDYNYPVAWGNFTKKGGGAVPDEFLRHEPTNRGMYTPNNHLFEMDDGTGNSKEDSGIRLTTSLLHKFHLIDDEAKPGILLQDNAENIMNLDSTTSIWTWDISNGLNVTLNGTDDIFSVTTSGGDHFSASADEGILMTTPANGGTSYSGKSGEVNILGNSKFNAADGQGAALNITGGKVALGNSSAELLDLFDQTLQVLIDLTTSMATETHIGNLGYPSSPPQNLSDYTSALSTLQGTIKTALGQIKGSL